MNLPPYQKTRLLHLGLLIFIIAAWLTSEGAGSYEEVNYAEFTVHKWLGMGVVLFVCLRLLYGFVGPQNVRFSELFPYTKSRLQLIGRDFLNVVTFKLPSGPTHQGLIGAIKLFGLCLFTWMATTGTLMFIWLEPDKEATGPIHIVMELHEIGEPLIPLYLVLHIGIVIFYAIKGRDLWRRMFFWQ